MKLLLFISILGYGQSKNYDFIVIGGGTAGCVVASELSANTDVDVLLLDHGKDEAGSLYTSNAFFGSGIPFSRNQLAHYIWSIDEPSKNLIVPKVLGGASSINGALFQSQSASDLASWGQPLWTFEATLEDRKAIETFESGGNPAVHGYDGPIHVHLFPPDPIMSLINVSMQNVFGIPYNNDSNSGVAAGVSIFARNLDILPNGTAVRQDSYHRFIQPILTRKNLDVVRFARVTKIDIRNNGNHRVQYTVGGMDYEDTAKKETILSLGVYVSPQMLMLSGIGNCSFLSTLDIECVHDNPQVGKNLVESSLGSMVYIGPTPTPSSNGCILGAIYRSPNFTGFGENMEAAVTNFPVVGQPGVSTYLWTLVQHKLSVTGTISLRDSDPLSNPLIRQNLYANQADVFEIVDMFRKIRQVMDNVGIFVEAFPGRVTTSGTLAVPVNSTDQQIAAYILQTIGVENHGMGTCRIGSVVDARLRVLGVPGLRVIDNSIIPVDLSTHSTAWSGMFVGKVGSRFIKEDWNL